jgi:solute carrier family 26 protein
MIEIIKKIGKTNVPTLVVSIIAMTALYVVKHFINERFKKKLPAPFPIELVVVALTTLFSYLLDFNKKYKIAIVGKIPLGFPTPGLPAFKITSILLNDAFNIAIVSFALNISMAKLFAKKYNYNIRPNQVKIITLFL